jgi:hypothetical protein
MGTRSWSKGRLYRIKNRLDIRIPFPYARVMECSLSSRQRFNFRFQFDPGRLVSALLLPLMLCPAPPQLEGQTGSATQACGGNSTVDALGAKTAASARAFLVQLQAAVQSNNKEDVAGMISYPLLVLRLGKRTHIQKKQAFLANYSLIFTDPVREAIQHQTAQCLFGNSSGAMIGNGEVWFREQAPDQWKIITINESASAP